VTDAAALEPWALGRRVVAALRSWPQFAWTPGALETLLATPDARRAVEDGVSPSSLQRWQEERKPALLY
jgi:hypothetical protein